ncbi:hypothetical protein C2G38_2098471, partial [Gigaspora rosea]
MGMTRNLCMVFEIPVRVVIRVVVEIVISAIGIGIIFFLYQLIFFPMPGLTSFVWFFAFPGYFWCLL